MKDEPFKIELINDLPADAAISFYKQGEFTDLCAGPHLDSTGRVKGNAIKLLTCNAAYWRGDSNRETLQRIYGIAFPKKEELDEYLARIEEAKRRDHRKLGRELGLFAFRDEAPGFPFYLPKGMAAVTNPLVNSYKRLVPGYEAPCYLAWSASNRSALIRIPAARGQSTRVELRCPDPTCNPYLALALCLAAGLDGIEKGLTPPAEITENIFAMIRRI